ncbi:hypothetical protein AB0J38_41055 [Streptomyces sp. NPDC050095]|uniref:hypothetical protein n=1 Tax=unclassified Streptomyces TaxID=2593676 RepID=UPI0034187FD5
MTEQGADYPTENLNGMSFIANRWVFTGLEGYRVKPVDGGFQVYHYTAAGERLANYKTDPMSEDEAHELAAGLAAPRQLRVF